MSVFIGQDEAVSAVTDAVIRARGGIKDPNRPVRQFYLSGADRCRQKQNSAGRLPRRCLMTSET